MLIDGGVGNYAWSPTGDRIAFDSHSTALGVVDVASGTVVPLVDTGGDTLGVIAFSPEGDQILYTRTDAKGVVSLWSVHTDGSDPHQLVARTRWTGGDWQVIPTR